MSYCGTMLTIYGREIDSVLNRGSDNDNDAELWAHDFYNSQTNND